MTPDLPLPPPDHTVSPHTGYTRAHWQAAADGLLAAAWRWATPSGALLDLPGRPSSAGVRSDGLEGYARTFLAAAFRVAGAAGADPHDWLGRYAEGLAAGTRTPGRDDLESWPLIRDIHVQGQPMVESASVALGLQLTRPWLWDRLDPAVQDRAERWLRDTLRHLPSPNNWYLFPFTVASFLESVGRGDEETGRARHRALELLESWYRGQGWYADGDGRAFDHYNGWALHLYPMLQAHLTEDAELAGVYGPRLRAHLESLALLFATDGAPIHFGRSLTYRFAAACAVALGAVTGHTPLPAGTSRRLISGCLRYFLDRGAVDAHGLLSPGWHGPHQPTVQPYSGPASPYWASKAFVALLADADHPLWTETETPAPSEEHDRILALTGPGLLIHSTAADGIVRLHNHGSDHVRPEEGESADAEDPLYARHAYSTHTGPTARGNPADNHFSVVLGSVRSVRRRIHPLGSGSDTDRGWAASWHQPVFPDGPPLVPGLRVESVTVVRGPYELRVHRVSGGPHGARAEQTGWATGPDEYPLSRLHPLLGWSDQDGVRAPRGTAFAPWASAPRLSADATGDRLFAAVATLTAEPPAVPASMAVTEATVADGLLRVHWYDDTVTHVAFAPDTGVTWS
ncbi:hypothetical protein SAMN04487981_105442 [Streptomyces sp. cf386]|uniref:DUF2264 domain-containing protein n=1 Tax=Streptomyces sp. cf386 TaxID=1761904 RepID=UPI00089016F8|nr:DUF2264 domain-containing protein [Streptomyces sp. cf386]SDN56111.1 hypothetical protein SAMN04487981_105442 [Streptomyces sp. cf386]